MPEWDRAMLNFEKLNTTGKSSLLCNVMAGIEWRLPNIQFSKK